MQVVNKVWDADEMRRLLRLSVTYSALLTPAQQRLWNLIFHSYRLWPEGRSEYIALSEIFTRIDGASYKNSWKG